jgi:hypothetical protein
MATINKTTEIIAEFANFKIVWFENNP